MANGPFLLVFTADSPTNFVNFCEQNPTHNILFNWHVDERRNVHGEIRPIVNESAYRLTFGLPEVLREEMLLDDDRGLPICVAVIIIRGNLSKPSDLSKKKLT
jgi:hypothetical protein